MHIQEHRCMHLQGHTPGVHVVMCSHENIIALVGYAL